MDCASHPKGVCVKRKILISPGYGAGWSSWNTDRRGVAEMMLTYQPIIDFLEAGCKFTEDDCDSRSQPQHPLLEQLRGDIRTKLGVDDACFNAAKRLKVETVWSGVEIREYDGNEHTRGREEDTDVWL